MCANTEIYATIKTKDMKTAEEFKGTKGIWEVLFIEFKNYDILCVAREDTVISQQTFGGKATEEMRANAQLIAAAPDLLEALMIINGDIERGPNPYTSQEIKGVVEKAINKALGK